MSCSSPAFLLNNHAGFSEMCYRVCYLSSTNEQEDPRERDAHWMHHQHCHWLISSGLTIKIGIISKLLVPRLSFLQFDLECLLKGLLFAEFLKVGIKYSIKVELSESIFIYTLQLVLSLEDNFNSNINQHNYSVIYDSISPRVIVLVGKPEVKLRAFLPFPLLQELV